MQIILWKLNTLIQHSNFVPFSQTAAKMVKPKTPSKASETAANKPAEKPTPADTTESKAAAQTPTKDTPEKKTLTEVKTKATSSKPAPEKVETSSASTSTDTDEAVKPVSTRSRVAESKVTKPPEKNQETPEVYGRRSLWFKRIKMISYVPAL